MEWFSDLPPVLQLAVQTGFVIGGAAVFVLTYRHTWIKPGRPPSGLDLARMEGNQKDALEKLEELTGEVRQLAQIVASGFLQSHNDRVAMLGRLNDVFNRLDRERR